MIDNANLSEVVPVDQSKYVVEISEQIAAGSFISHVLNYEFSEEPDNKAHAAEIKDILRNSIWNIEVVEHLPVRPNADPIPIPIIWRTPATRSSSTSNYYTEAGFIYSDNAIRIHTRQMLQRLTNHIRATHPEFGTDWKLSYIVSRAVDVHILQASTDITNHNNVIILPHTNPAYTGPALVKNADNDDAVDEGEDD